MHTPVGWGLVVILGGSIIAISITSLPLQPASDKVLYDGHQILRIHPRSKRDVRILKQLQASPTIEGEFLQQPVGAHQHVNVMVPTKNSNLLEHLKNKGFDVHVTVPNVQELIDQQMERTDNSESTGDNFDFSNYHPYEEIVDWLQHMSQKYPDIMTLIDLGKSYENRPIYAVKISKSKRPRPAVWMDAGIHSNEWVGPATLLYFINEFVRNADDDAGIGKLLHHLDIYILPLFNVDGYVYTWTTDRMWRKNRARHPNITCIGVDLNRNWDSFWEEGLPLRGPCQRDYRGPHAFSEPESQSVGTFLQQHNESILAYLAYHSFSQMWMTPYSHTTKSDPGNLNELLDMAEKIVDAIGQMYGTNYVYGRVSDLVGEAAGASIDYTYDQLNIPYSFGVELRDTGNYGTLLPPGQIIPNAEESMAGIKMLGRLLIKKLAGGRQS